MNVKQANKYLNSLINFEQSLQKVSDKEIKLERMTALMQALGNPQTELKTIHVAGTKGKGSTSVMIADMLKSAGFKVGLYTSPHIHDRNERIRILDQDRTGNSEGVFADSIIDEDIADLLSSIKDILNQVNKKSKLGKLTFYEVFTALAFCYFKQQNVDYVVLETGLGGRLDATNVCDSFISVLTPISLEHTNILGDTLTLIAREKAAIIKDQQTVVIAPQEDEAMNVIVDRCRAFDNDFIILDSQSQSENVRVSQLSQTYDLRTSGHLYPDVELSLLGDHQRMNAAVAVHVIECLRKHDVKVSESAIRTSLKSIRWPLRYEIIHEQPFVILDAAHNEASALALRRTIMDAFPDLKVALILGVSEDKKIPDICASLKPIVKRVYFTQAKHKRAHKFTRQEAGFLFSGIDTQFTKNTADAFRKAMKSADSSDVILVTGSIFVTSEVRSIIKG